MNARNPRPAAQDPTRYVPPGGRMDRWSQVATRWLTERGISLMGSRVITVVGRRSGTPRRVVVNLLTLDGERYLVAPRGNTQWVRNARAAGGGELALGRRTEHVVLTELPAEQRAPVLRVYLDRWGWEVGRFVEGLTRDSTDAELEAAAPGFPVLRVTPA
ncbi:nitroreductase/quinone reductase family protein [Oryzobacter telluris]|uniref:nitroreductase/quinone reductase family protein n=1 Tax=Oryzobacter telluris TaxID=3149179 RepID=UPI00370DD2BB